VITRVVEGGGHSAFFLNNAGATASAQRRARANLNRALSEAIEPVHCHACGIFQPEMVEVLRQRYGKRYDPNKYASERVAMPATTAWRLACKANNVDTYAKFMEVWPNYTSLAKLRIKELKYPYLPYLRKAILRFGWIAWGIAWGAAALLLAGFYFFYFATLMR
jgi:hypothetical protein